MMKSKKFFVILQSLYKNKVMAKKKTSKSSKEKTASSLSEALDLKNIFHNERTNFILGAFLFIVAGFMLWAFISFLATGNADISNIETPLEGEILNQNHEFQNACGSLGAYTAWFFIKRCFGFAAFLIPVYIFLIAKTGTSLSGQTSEVVYVLGHHYDMVLGNLRKVPWSLV